jgi:hypothetical protein
VVRRAITVTMRSVVDAASTSLGAHDQSVMAHV